ncbi:hypothetical protein HAV15_004813 [Penicillium sp. str. |nr:hypothetical protein HAV15_004813 [Penicillium sp. str. \
MQVVGYPLWNIIYNLLFHPLREYPGPKLFAASTFTIYYYRVRGLGAKVVPALHEKYGPIVRISPNELSYIESQAWKDIFGHRAGGKPSFPKDPVQLGPNPPGSEGIIRSDDASHARQRRIFSHAFSDRALREQESMIRQYVEMLVKRLRMIAAAQENSSSSKQAQANMVKLFNFTTFDIMGDLAFAEPLNMLRDGEYVPWVESIFATVKLISLSHAMRRFNLEPLFKMLLSKSINQKRKEHIRFANEKVDCRMVSKTDKPDIWSLVIKNAGKDVSKGEMYSNASTFMITGTETTATVLSGFTWLVCKNPEALQKLKVEIRGLGVYLNACLEEGLRMYPPVPVASMRLVPKGGTIICDKMVPEGVTVGIPHLAAYHSARNFIDPMKFLPERWLPDTERFQDDQKSVFQPFSFGPRSCLSKNLAYHEMRLIISSIPFEFDISLVDNEDNWLDQKNYELWEKKPLFVRLTPAS